jgi:hypothetical protein
MAKAEWIINQQDKDQQDQDPKELADAIYTNSGKSKQDSRSCLCCMVEAHVDTMPCFQLAYLQYSV